MQIPAVAAIGVLALLPPLVMAQKEDPFASAHAANCSTCHGERMEGAAQGRRCPARHGSVAIRYSMSR